MVNATIEEMQQDPLKYLLQVEAGETVLITRAAQPIAELKPIAKPELIAQSNQQLRPFGLCAGEFRVPDDFDAPLPEEVLSAFEGQ